MASIRPCNKCGERISIRQMPHQQWVAFDVGTDNPHKCLKKNIKKNKNIKPSVVTSISNKESEQINTNYDFEEDNFENEINEIENLKSLKRDSTIYNNEENSNNFFKNPLIIAIIVIIFLAIFVYP
tara:strand:- start:154 stop:531 length:378 start_codon:yes stop_codon:yes gene_type:complete